MTAGIPRTQISTLYSASIDSELEHRLANYLYQRDVPGGNSVQLNAHGGVVALSGELPTRYAKWLCIECCRRVAGVIKVIDNMKIEPAINERPTAVHIPATLVRPRQNRRYTLHHATTIERATNGTVADQHPRLLAAA